MDSKHEKTIYQKNMAALMESNIFLWDIVKEEVEYQDSVYIEESVQGEKIAAIERDQELWYLNSRYDAKRAVEVWAQSIGKVNHYTVFLVLGFGNGMYLEELRKRYPDNLILVYEPSKELFDSMLHEIDLTNIWSDEKIFLAVGEDGMSLFMQYVQSIIMYSNFRYVIWKNIPNYERIFPMEYLKIKKIYMNWVREITLNRNTLIILQNEFAMNFFQNLWECLNGYSMDTLKCRMKQKFEVEKYPAIVVSAGPSLDKNIHELKKAKNRAYIIVVDTALKAVLRAGIIPDIAVTVDPHKPLVLFEDERIAELPMLVCLSSNTEVLHKHKGKKIFFGESESYLADICKKYKKELSPLESGGSVANNAFSLAKYLGFQKIFLVGQDLAYPDQKGHTSAAYDDEQKNRIDVTENKYIEVEDIYGGKVWTEGNMDAYRMWFETQIVRYSELHVIDATEGGAKIHGTEIMTLREAIQRECMELEAVDFGVIMDEITPYFSQEELAEVREQLFRIPVELDAIKEKLNEGKELYRKLDLLVEHKMIHTEEVRELGSQIKDLSEWLEEKSEMKLVDMYNYQADYNMQAKVFEIQKELEDELKTIAFNGKEMMDSYFDAMEALEKNLHVLYQSMQDCLKNGGIGVDESI